MLLSGGVEWDEEGDSNLLLLEVETPLGLGCVKGPAEWG